jgi:hypothetical protein
MPDEKRGIMSLPLFPSIGEDELIPPQLHGQMGFNNAAIDYGVAWLDCTQSSKY